MEEIVTATRAVREFSDLLNTIKFKGRTFIIERGGKPVARMVPIDLPRKTVSLKDLSRLLRELPELGSEAASLKKDLRRISQEQPSLPTVPPWE
jgi:antitoxin (DNA-binding transcriptional repressor) of toxin-antitoxin stability system